MKFTANTKDVANALKKATACLSGKAIVPVLNNALFEASDDGFVMVTCTDLCQRISVSFPAEVEAPAKTTIPAKKLLSILNNLTADEVTFDTKENNHTAIVCGTTQIDICGLDTADYPEKTGAETEIAFSIDAKELAELFKCGGYAVNTQDDGRKVLTGVLIEVDSNGIISVVSTDGKRLAVAENNCAVETEETKKYIVPAAVVALLQKLKGDEIELELCQKYLTARTDDMELQGKLIEGNFPNWRQVFLSGLPNAAVISSAVLLNKIAIISQMLPAEAPLASFVFGVNKVEFKTNNDDGSILDSMEIEFQPPKNEPITLMFNPAFIAAAVANCGGEKFVFNFKDGASPCTLEFENNVKAVIMPIRKK